MADGITLAKAYVQIMPSTEGIEKNLEDVMSDAGEKGGKKGGNAAGVSFSDAVKVVLASQLVRTIEDVFSNAVSGIANIIGQSVSLYSEYEQLVGGAQLMFGDAFSYVSEQAQNAYATVGMSQNEYLDQVNGFATGLTTALGGNQQAAAELADRIVRAEADVVAATGRSRDSIENAFNGIMRSNYTMLDNLQLGIKPTKEGFQELIDQVNAWNAANGEATDYQIDNLADAQSALVDYIEMQGLAGYASMEAGDTMSGSTAAVSAAWQNLLLGLADGNADLGTLIDNLVTTLTGAISNYVPIIEQAMQGFSQLVRELGPVIVQEFPQLVQEILPGFLDGITAIVQALNETLPTVVPPLVNLLVDTISTNAPLLVTGALTLITTLAESLLSPENVEQLTNAAIQIVTDIAQWLGDNAGLLINGAVQMILALLQALIDNASSLIEAALTMVLTIADALTQPDYLVALVMSALDLILALVQGIIDNLPLLIEQAPVIIANLVDAIIRAVPQILTAAWEIIKALVEGIGENLGPLLDAGAEIIFKIGEGIASVAVELYYYIADALKKIDEGFAEWLEGVVQWGRDLIDNFIKGLKEKWESLKSAISDLAQGIANFLGFSVPEEGPLSDFAEYAPDMMKLYAQGIRDNQHLVTEAIEDASADFASAMNGNVQDYVAEISYEENRMRGTAQESGELADNERYGGDTFNITIDAKNVKEFNDIIDAVKNARRIGRMVTA